MAMRLTFLLVLASLTAEAQLVPVGSFSHLVSAGGWTTTFTLHNNGAMCCAVNSKRYVLRYHPRPPLGYTAIET